MSNEATNPASCQTAVSGSAFSISDLKCGNLLNYDTAEGEILPTVIDLRPKMAYRRPKKDLTLFFTYSINRRMAFEVWIFRQRL